MTASSKGAASSRVLGVFAKWPQPGEVKTRLTPDPDRGAAVARAFLLDTLARLSGVAARRMVAFAPAMAEANFACLVPSSFGLTPQPDGDLGQRLVGFVTQQLEAGAETIVVVGADSPTLPVEYVERAFAELERADVVLGPATDGGYYLLGCGRRLPPLFEGVAWGGSRVLAETVERLSDPGWRLAVLPPWYDVDTPEGWDMLRGHLAALRRSGIDPGVAHTEVLTRRPSP
jgi:rSAM/selenodomain-associated transferase 1